jgi:hypothetical protein
MIKRNVRSYLFLALLTMLSACASLGTPKGGPKDTTSPKLLSSIPLENARRFNGNRVEIKFSELVALNTPSEKVLISPPQVSQPEVKALADKVVVILSDTLIANTTYTIDFTDAIVDYNEGNKFGDYAFSFSTGDQIDSMRLSGIVIDASNLNPLNGIVVGSHSKTDDSIFRKMPFDRISKTNANGFFTIKGLTSNRVSVFALGDKNRDFKFDQPAESIAFLDTSITPYFEPCTKVDTIWKDTANIDTIMVRSINCFKPDNLILKSFTENFGRQYLARKERVNRNKIVLTFGSKSVALPTVKLLNYPSTDWYILESNPTKDTLVYWIKDTSVVAMDTLRLEMNYLKSDSLNQLISTTDTLTFFSRSMKVSPESVELQKDKKPSSKPTRKKEILHLVVDSDLGNIVDVDSKPFFTFREPIEPIVGMPWHLYMKQDTVWKKTPFQMINDSLYLRSIHLDVKWVFDTEYKFELDSGSVRSIFGLTNDGISQTFKVRSEEDYSRLTVSVFGLRHPSFVELLDRTDKVVRRLKIINGIADFKFLMPGTYYLRAIEDLNGNFKWDTGNFEKKCQPEQVFYNPRAFKLRENWDVNESWNVNELPLLDQKPKELMPKETKSKR